MVDDRTARDRRLRERLVNGDEQALADVYDEYGPLVYGLAARVTGDGCAAEDITQEVFLWLWENAGQYAPERAPLRGWLCTVARRRAIDWLRRSAAEHRCVQAQAREPTPSTSLEELVAADSIAKAVRSAVAELPSPQRAALVLAFYGGLTYRQVAQLLDVPEGTAKSRLRKALRSIGDRLASEGALDGWR